MSRPVTLTPGVRLANMYVEHFPITLDFSRTGLLHMKHCLASPVANSVNSVVPLVMHKDVHSRRPGNVPYASERQLHIYLSSLQRAPY